MLLKTPTHPFETHTESSTRYTSKGKKPYEMIFDLSPYRIGGPATTARFLLVVWMHATENIKKKENDPEIRDGILRRWLYFVIKRSDAFYHHPFSRKIFSVFFHFITAVCVCMCGGDIRSAILVCHKTGRIIFILNRPALGAYIGNTHTQNTYIYN